MFRKILAALLCTVMLFALPACAPNPAALYENTFDDLDIGGRINECAGKIEKYDTSLRLEGSLNALREDLLSIESDDEDVQIINEEFLGVIDLLREAAHAQKNGDAEAFEANFFEAISLYAKTNSALNKLKRSMGQGGQLG
jgi:hypothetical protein